MATSVQDISNFSILMEQQLWWGNVDPLHRRREQARKLLMAIYSWNRVDAEEYDTLNSMINSPLEEDLSLAETILKVK